MNALPIIMIVCTVLSTLGVGGIISLVMSRKMKRMDIRQEQREEARVKEFRLMYWGVRTGGNLAKQSAMALQRMGVNDPLNKAVIAYEEFEKERDKYLEAQVAEANHG